MFSKSADLASCHFPAERNLSAINWETLLAESESNPWPPPAPPHNKNSGIKPSRHAAKALKWVKQHFLGFIAIEINLSLNKRRVNDNHALLRYGEAEIWPMALGLLFLSAVMTCFTRVIGGWSLYALTASRPFLAQFNTIQCSETCGPRYSQKECKNVDCICIPYQISFQENRLKTSCDL